MKKTLIGRLMTVLAFAGWAGGVSAATLTFEEIGDLPSTGVHYFEDIGAFSFETIRCNCQNPSNHYGVGLLNFADTTSSAANKLYNTPENAVYLSQGIDVRMTLATGDVFDLESMYLGNSHFQSPTLHLKGYLEDNLIYEMEVAIPNIPNDVVGALQYVDIGMQGIDRVEWSVSSISIGYVAMDSIGYSVVPIRAAGIEIENLTNGSQADGASDSDVPRVAQGETIAWTYLVTNTGEIDVSEAEIIVIDSQPGITPVLDVASDIDTDLLLSPGETWTYTASAQALDLENPPAEVSVVPGCNDGRNTYQNTGRVEIIGGDVSDEDLSHYCNFGNTDIDIRKQAEGPDTQTITIGSDAIFEIQVTNSGAIDLQDIVVSDAKVSSCGDTIEYLGAGESMTYTCQAIAVAAGFTSEACVSGTSYEGVSTHDCDESTVEVEVVIDIKPSRKSSTNVINLKRDRDLQVAIVGSDTFDALLVDQATVTFGSGEASPVGNQVKDYNKDGFSDLLLTFSLVDTGIACDDTEATLSGVLYGGGTIQGSDDFTFKRCP
jgi:hypothetical protein